MSTIKSKKRDKLKHSATGRTKNNGGASKGGAGGKGTWGKPGVEYKYDDDAAYLDWQDPNYDEEEHGGFYFSSVPAKEAEKAFAASIETQKTFKQQIRAAAREYFQSPEKAEFVTKVKETKMRDSLLYHEIVKELVRMSMDKDDKGKHHATDLLRYLVRERVLESTHVFKGFYHLLNQIHEITIDVPKAKDKLDYIIGCSLLFGLTQDEIDRLRSSLKQSTDQKTLKEVKAKLTDMAKEYMDSEDISELSRCFTEMKMPYMGHELVKRGISTSMDRGPRERELMSRAIAEMTGESLIREEASKGFEILLQRVEDLIMDVPNVLEYLSSFVSRAIADEAVAPSFLVQAHIQEGDGGYAVIKQAQQLLSQSGAMQRLSRVWGPSAGDGVMVLKKAIHDLILEYFSSNDVDEAVRLATEVPVLFHHEIVKRVFVLALDRKEREMKLAAKLLLTLMSRNVMLISQMKRGLERIECSLDDMALDNVKAKSIYETFKLKFKEALGTDIAKEQNPKKPDPELKKDEGKPEANGTSK
uniref:MI domain-containing protein n=1 Tax=Lotharella globosa TaxID=91324 RepID=A0A6V3QQJ3_9EUKA|mmetsp:Transcript_4555/g.8671  ORF Transcript_4555/g.8671 Transcript_4555/m.8671 type:complete len:529 (+) Transcript_4555:128-1714(+)|eukprot:CAMPEP_0167786664 /NCGR_PEP_ID=MMETSP0111_2-20121227/8943_1 /TAXON_ID=91324 /ORGANISM="Lotharella globosa, Strain CCCM811" /LENGTH=528 /DNA_ID=CAMNT_0007678121 /DNA_START=96 /DNA_END=1682 /DNA_ORIENTATION=-